MSIPEKKDIPKQENTKKKEPVCHGCNLHTPTGSFVVHAGCPVHNKLMWTLPKPRGRRKK
jgi:hypothetical protein